MICREYTEYSKKASLHVKYILLSGLSFVALTGCFNTQDDTAIPDTEASVLDSASAQAGSPTSTGSTGALPSTNQPDVVTAPPPPQTPQTNNPAAVPSTPAPQPGATPPQPTTSTPPSPSTPLPASDGKVTLFSMSPTASDRGFMLSADLEENVDEAFLTLTTQDGDLIIGDMPMVVDPDTGASVIRVNSDDIPVQENIIVATVSRSVGAATEESNAIIPINRSGDDIRHLISRITYGVKPGLEQRVRDMGYEAYVEQQLNPAAIADTNFNAATTEALIPRDSFFSDGFGQGIKMMYGASSEKQLLNIMADFWENHFHTEWRRSVFQDYEFIEKRAYRANAFGKFRDLLGISANSPAMMLYLDNAQNKAGQMNENYARELMELHTVGVDSSYSPEDIIEVARVFTGWNARITNVGAGKRHHVFQFNADDHDTDDKRINFLNVTIRGLSGDNAKNEGEQLLDLLARHPDTASFICGKLIAHFVSDTPIISLQNECASVFLSTDGDIREVMRALLLSNTFRNMAGLYLSKFKNPFEYFISVVRALEIEGTNGFDSEVATKFSAGAIAAGYDTYGFSDPTGISDDSINWMGSASLATRIDTALALIRERRGIQTGDYEKIYNDLPTQTPEAVAGYFCSTLLYDRCTDLEFRGLVNAAIGIDDIFNPDREGIQRMMERTSQFAVGTVTFQMQ